MSQTTLAPWAPSMMSLHQPPRVWPAAAAANTPHPGLTCQQVMAGACRAASGWLALPFDALRAQYGAAVRLGLLRRSMLDARDVERTLGALEGLTLGALARRV